MDNILSDCLKQTLINQINKSLAIYFDSVMTSSDDDSLDRLKISIAKSYEAYKKVDTLISQKGFDCGGGGGSVKS